MRRLFRRVTIMAVLGAVLLWMGCETYEPLDSSSFIGDPGEGGGFLWKPISESDGKLVVLLPTQYRGRVEETYISDSEGEKVEAGRFTGDTHNGKRPHYRFTRSGAEYGSDLYVVANVTDEGLVHWHVPEGATRTTY